MLHVRWLIALAMGGAVTAPLIAADSAAARIVAAGNAATESEQLRIVRELTTAQEPELDATTGAELTALLPVIEAWAEGRERAAAEVAQKKGESHRYLHQFFNTPTLRFTPVYPTAPRTNSAVYPLWAFYRARFLTWCLIEDSSVSAVPERKAAFVAEAERCFALARAAFPQNEVLKIYSGENQPIADLSPWDDRAPEWANHQRRILEQLHRIIRWWIAERQLTNGEFGGKWGDDVEMWRWWSAVLIGFDDPVVNAAQEKLARGNLSRPALAAGYTNQLTDVEHTAEETADTLTPMQHIAPNDPEWSGRVRRLVELAEATWWGKNERGQRQFKHIDFNHERLGDNASRAYDTGYHVRVMQPVLLMWQRTRDPALGDALLPWLWTWAEAALGRDNGKPAGIVPAALQWPSGLVGSKERSWIGPNLAGDPMERLYSWPGYPVSAMTATLVQAHAQTGEALFLEPLLRMAEMRRAHLAAGNQDGPVGSAAWAAHRLPGIINDALSKWRQLSGDPRFDDLLSADANGYVRYLLTHDSATLARGLADTANTLSFNWPMFTSEVRYTDRVLTFPHAWPRTIATGLQKIDAALVYSMVTGDPGAVDHFPLNGARWHTLPLGLAVLVAENRRDRFGAELYHFGRDDRALAVSLLTLEPGNYTWRLTSEDGRLLARGQHRLSAENRRLSLSIPPATVCQLSVQLAMP